MKTLVRQRSFHVAIALMVAFFIAAVIIPSQHLKTAMDVLRISIALVVTAVWAKPAFHAMRDGARLGGDQLVVGCFLLWTVVDLQATWIPVSRFNDFSQPTKDLVGAGLAYLFAIAGAFYLIPIGNIEGHIPARNWRFMLAVMVVAAMLTGFVFGMNFHKLTGVAIPTL